MFRKILIANRGEIACRIIRTCRRLGIATVAVHSEADSDALFVRMADEKVPIGPPPAAESYLSIARIVEAARGTGAEAVHPGYGFLSERAAFAEALDAAGITFIGPPVAAIEAMGDKIESKRLARAAGVSIVPGTLEAIADAGEARRVARDIGYPLMVKASAGGGGKGMRIVHAESALAEALERASSEARSSFGDDRVFIEKFVEEPRHIEIQVLGDRHGHVVHLGERECSIQRRHQKVIEEAPSPFLDSATRAAMGAQAIRLSEAVRYYSAGTVEFIVDRDRNFYFLEMNTRLQVEHPVTELAYDVDLVELMIRVAAGEPLPFRQAELQPRRWAVEARVYAEDPRRGFLPSTGRLVRYIEPENPEIRIDSGVEEGSEVSIFYDPMIAKVVGFGSDRPSAVATLERALDGFVIWGPTQNLAFLTALLGHPRFTEGRLSTSFIAEEFGERFKGVELPPPRWRRLAAALVALRLEEEARARLISGRLPGHQWLAADAWRVELGEENLEVTVVEAGPPARLIVAGETLLVRLDRRPGVPVLTAEIDGESLVLQADPIPEGWSVRHGGAELCATVRTREAAELAARMPRKLRLDTSKHVKSPMPGLIVRVGVAPGQEVKAGQELLVLEAMKMENVLRSEQDGTVAEVRVAARDTVSADQVLLTFA